MPQKAALGAAVYAFYDALGSFETTPGTTASALSVIKEKGQPVPTGVLRPHWRGAATCTRDHLHTTSFSASLRSTPALKVETQEPHLDDPATEARHVR